MKKTIDEHAERFSEAASTYDDEQDSEAYHACARHVVDHAAPTARETVLDLGTGTGAIAFELTSTADCVIGRDISTGMLDEARMKASAENIENIKFAEGRFREPNLDSDTDVDIVTSNFAMHHLSDDEKREAITVISALEPDRFVLGDVMFFGSPDPEEPFYSPSVDDPATVGILTDALTDVGMAVTEVEFIHEQVGVIVAEQQ
ncbi:class I SAM-dependent methyltransferase [Haloquadratum walsbyi]|jgi:Methylase involved in ubiquinone/menaquinone biosynthesis|uniref:Methylase involved in ubiquinone/menaquinone biosynthesis n=1 Tax=Haloquadratum walsbyi J07HQW2 TaxID=1238425 RepID=U1NI03_9EURY|nr:class I SAM-dependent methyltransferase [Haloquadratum walsbyi]ERG96513.1 MAG: methylase involved in ubiquinone/menaquinone biosynthesis [Haloquadratum walsbyi J07HQW2]